MFSSNNSQWNDSHSCKDPSQEEDKKWDVERLIAQEDAIYDYERVPAAWSGFDEQPTIYAYGDAEIENTDRQRRSSKQ